MNYGMYIAASGMQTNMYRQDVIANNLANINTTAFKPDVVTFRHRDPERIEDGLVIENPNRLLEKLGGGVLVNPNRVNFSDGPLERTNRPLDLAIRGEGFFAFTSGSGDNDARLRFSRDGRFSISEDGYLIHSTSGMRALDTSDRTIRVDPAAGEVKIEPNGDIRQGARVITRLQLTTVPDVNAFEKAGSNMFKLDNFSQQNRRAATGSLVQGALEGSAVNPMLSLNAINSASSAVAASARMLQYHDELLGSAINRLGRVT